MAVVSLSLSAPLKSALLPPIKRSPLPASLSIGTPSPLSLPSPPSPPSLRSPSPTLKAPGTPLPPTLSWDQRRRHRGDEGVGGGRDWAASPGADRLLGEQHRRFCGACRHQPAVATRRPVTSASSSTPPAALLVVKLLSLRIWNLCPCWHAMSVTRGPPRCSVQKAPPWHMVFDMDDELTVPATDFTAVYRNVLDDDANSA